MLLTFLLHSPVAAICLWAAVYTSDYYLTLYGARLYRSGPHRHLEFEGSYELTPVFQRDIDLMRRVSARFLLALAFSAVALFGVWLIGVRALRVEWPLAVLLGGLVLREAAVHLRHFRNIAMFRMARQTGALAGKLVYPRWFLLRSSAFELFSFAAFFLFLAAIVGGWFFVGGALSCAATGFQQLRRSGKAVMQVPGPGAETIPVSAGASEAGSNGQPPA